MKTTCAVVSGLPGTSEQTVDPGWIVITVNLTHAIPYAAPPGPSAGKSRGRMAICIFHRLAGAQWLGTRPSRRQCTMFMGASLHYYLIKPDIVIDNG